MSTAMDMSSQGGGHLYMQTNEIRNAIVHYRWSKSGTLTEVERVPTGGAGSGTFKPISGQESAPNAFEVGYATHPDGSLEEITRVTIPYNSPQGLVGF